MLSDEKPQKRVAGDRRGPCRMRTGRKIMARIRSSAPPAAIPTMRNGSNISHTIGYNTSASRASGQHSTSKMHHKRKVNIPARCPCQSLRSDRRFSPAKEVSIARSWIQVIDSPWLCANRTGQLIIQFAEDLRDEDCCRGVSRSVNSIPQK